MTTTLSRFNAETNAGSVYSSVDAGELLVELSGVTFEEFHRITEAFRKAERIARQAAMRDARRAVEYALSKG